MWRTSQINGFGDKKTRITFKKERFLYVNNNKIVLLTFETNLKTLYYIEMWQSLINTCESTNLIFNPKTIRVDFERSAHLEIIHCFPLCDIYGCRFHLGFPYLRNEYKANPEIRKWIKYFFGLSFISPEEVFEVLCELIEILSNSDVLHFRVLAFTVYWSLLNPIVKPCIVYAAANNRVVEKRIKRIRFLSMKYILSINIYRESDVKQKMKNIVEKKIFVLVDNIVIKNIMKILHYVHEEHRVTHYLLIWVLLNESSHLILINLFYNQEIVFLKCCIMLTF
ncbi:hypothetical protein QTP88_008906 [Uroleucon formosanum]